MKRQNKSSRCINCTNKAVIETQNGQGLCRDCIKDFHDLLFEHDASTNGEKQEQVSDFRDFELKTPEEIVSYLDLHVVGQGSAKKRLSIAAYLHQKRIKNPDNKYPVNNVLMVAPTGSGKTLLAQKLAESLDVPFYDAEATALTESGFVGKDVETVIRGLYDAAGGDKDKAEHGIVFIDEIDKLRKRGESANITADVGTEGVQAALLKMLSGSTITLPAGTSGYGSRVNPSLAGGSTEINTSNILFVVAGAFSGIEDIVQQGKQIPMGFGHRRDEEVGQIVENGQCDFTKVTKEHLREYGLIPEFTGRFGQVAGFNALTRDELKRVIFEPKNSIFEQYRALFAEEGVALSLSEDSVAGLIDEAVAHKTGARGLDDAMVRLLESYLFRLPTLREEMVELAV